MIDAGRRKVVYREAGPSLYDGVEVELGPRCDEYYPVVTGLEAGDRVATAGSFLIDAEARLEGLQKPETPPAARPSPPSEEDVLVEEALKAS